MRMRSDKEYMGKRARSSYYFRAQLVWSWVYRIKKRRIYRTIKIPGYYTMHELAVTILESFNLSPDHHFGFYNTIDWPASPIAFETTEESPLLVDIMWRKMFSKGRKTIVYDVDEITVSRPFRNIGDYLLLIFDYGDLWIFLVELVHVRDEGLKRPEIVDSVGDSPVQYPEPETQTGIEIEKDFPEIENHPKLKNELLSYDARTSKIIEEIMKKGKRIDEKSGIFTLDLDDVD
ncbi:MAG: hypothetical protein KIH08_05925 [Candidatus Freyarchaeota archaeon]|nr:hypothetical protein [Candidatus Jordarchaeia archaeon]MBS7270335.1 hypothetical protein [Candidatus Jordarchaeia archaeon]MBS7281310.1 hypothetical protein [Candidatus Jordarchaeia archaeon]